MLMEVDHMYTLQEVKDRLQIGYGRIMLLIDQEKLEAFSLDEGDPSNMRALRIPESSLKEYLQTRKVLNGNGVINARNANYIQG